MLSICFTENGYVASGDSNGTISLWDPKTIKIIKQAIKVTTFIFISFLYFKFSIMHLWKKFSAWFLKEV